MDGMSSPRFYTSGDGRDVRQGTSLLYIAGEKTRASAPWGSSKRKGASGISRFPFFRKESQTVYRAHVMRTEKGRPQK